MTVFTSKTLYTPLRKIEDALLSVENGAIISVASRNDSEDRTNKAATDFGDCVIVPGFFDIHIHGGVNCDVMRGSADEMTQFETFLAKHGVTSYFPTTVTASQDATLSALERLANRIEAAKDCGGAWPLGIHLE